MNNQDLDGRTSSSTRLSREAAVAVVAEAMVSAAAAARLRKKPGRSSSIMVTVKKRGGSLHPSAPTFSSKAAGQRGSDLLASRRRLTGQGSVNPGPGDQGQLTLRIVDQGPNWPLDSTRDQSGPAL
ncbi:hypothetical protein Sjap_007861 [Stephania japonica]|uniref:Uncharacterized protein n=1 Tax=Stephania japonica TaxID=461633 RepID=A0AAP0JQR8_9MAGN